MSSETLNMRAPGVALTQEGEGLETVCFEVELTRPPHLMPLGIEQQTCAAWAILSSRYCNNTTVAFDVVSNDNPAIAIEVDVAKSHVLDELCAQILEHQVCIDDEILTGTQRATSCLTFNSSDETSDILGHYPILIASSLTSLELKIAIRSHASAETAIQLRRLLYQLRHILNQIFTHVPRSTATVADLDLLCPEDQQQLLEWNAKMPATVPHTIHELLTRQAQLRPNALAIDAHDGQMTFAEFDRAVERVARWMLASHALCKGDFVPMVMDKSLWSQVAIAAIVRTGCVAVSLDVTTPRARLEHIFEEVKPKFAFISGPAILSTSGFAPTTAVALNAELFDQLSVGHECLPLVTLQDLAVCVFSSGSTGVPKGIILDHQSISTSCIYHGDAMQVGPDSKILAFASASFDVAVYDTFTTLAQGATVCVPSESERKEAMSTLIQKYDVTWATITPAALSLMQPYQVPTLKAVNLVGDCPTLDNIQQWAHHLALFNGYGSAESSTCAPGQLLPHHQPTWFGKTQGACGWIVDAEDPDKLVPIGAIGEMVVEGPIVSRGYLNMPEKTADVFFGRRPNWLAHRTDSRLYRMGDLVKYMPDGNMMYCGRKDQQIRVRGHKVEPGEIEAKINNYAKLSGQVVVEPVRPTGRDMMLAAFIATDPESTGDPQIQPITTSLYSRLQDLEAHLVEILPSYMVPSLFIPMNRLPVLTTAKVDHKALRLFGSQLDHAQLLHYGLGELFNDEVRVLSAAEKQMRHAWSSVLGIPEDLVSPRQSFFRLGGDSIKMQRLITLVNNHGYTLTNLDAFKNPTLEAMAKVVRKCELSHESSLATKPFIFSDQLASRESILKIAEEQCTDYAKVQNAFPLTPLQTGFFALNEKEKSSYVDQHCWDLPSGLSLEAVQSACQAIHDSTSILRTRVISTPGGDLIQVTLDGPIRWHTADSLQEYLLRDKADNMGFGQALNRFAVAEGKYFVWTTHHAVIDYTTIELVLSRLNTVLSNKTLESEVPFALFIQHLQSLDISKCVEYWGTYLEGSIATSFPKRKVVVQGEAKRIESAIHDIALPRMPPTAITMTTILSCAYALVLGRYDGATTPEVTFGCTMSGRNANVRNIGSVVGPTITTIPVRATLEKNLKVTDFLESMQQAALDRIPYEHYGLSAISSISGATRRACDFKTIMVVQPAARETSKLLNNELLSQSATNFTTYPLLLQCWLGDDLNVKLEATFDTDHLNKMQVQLLMSHVEHVCAQLLRSDEESTLADIDLFGLADEQLVRQWMQPNDPVQHQCLHQVIFSFAERTPNAAAVESQDVPNPRGFVTYQELDQITDRIACQLAHMGVRIGDLVPCLFEKGFWITAAEIAVMKAGGGFLSLDPDHPAARHQSILDQTKSQFGLASARHANRLGNQVQNVLELSRETFETFKHEVQELPRVTADDVAYTIFTSGTSGVPKGVLMQHKAVVRSTAAHGSRMGFSNQTRALNFSSNSFDALIVEKYTTFSFGGCVITPTDHQKMNGLEAFMRDSKVNWTVLPSSVSKLISPENVPSLKTFVQGGEPMSQSDIERWYGKVQRLHNGYGPTETCVFCVENHITSPNARAETIGRSVGSHCFIVDPDDHNKLAPVGTVGELVAAGDALAKGYLNLPGKTAESFIENVPWLSQLSQTITNRIYKTGDLARFNVEDGTVDCLGRKDHQIKLRGQRIELGEIDQQAINSGACTAAAVLLKSDNHGEIAQAVAFETTTTSDVDTSKLLLPASAAVNRQLDQLRSKLTERLPSYMVPRFLIPLRAMPVMASGKQDRVGVRNLLQSLSREYLVSYDLQTSQKVVPKTPMERLLQSIWSEVLKVEPKSIGREDNFFMINGDSLSAMKLASVARNTPALESISVAMVFRHPKLRDLAQALEEAQIQANATTKESNAHTNNFKAEIPAIAEQLALPVDSICDVYPASPLQEGLMALSASGQGSYVTHKAYGIPVGFDFANFEASWKQTVDKMDILRTRIVFRPGHGALQVVLDGSSDVHYLTQSLDKFLEDQRAVTTTYGSQLFQLSLLKEQETLDWKTFVLTMHHSIFDAWSLQIVLDEVSRAFDNIVNPKKSLGDLTSKIVQPRVFADYLNSQSAQQANDFWTARLAGPTYSSFPAKKRDADTVRQEKRATRRFLLKEAKATGVTNSTVLRAAFGVLVSRYTNTNDVAFGTVVTGRSADVKNIEHMACPTIASVPMRVQVDRQQTAFDFLRQVQAQASETIPYEQIGLQAIRKLSADARHACDFSSMFVVQPYDALEKGDALGDFGLSPIQMKEEDFQGYPLLLQCWLQDDGMVLLDAQFDSSVIGEENVTRILRHLENAACNLVSAASDAASLVDNIGMSDSEEVEQLMSWKGPGHTKVERSIDDVLKEMTAKRPNAIALSTWHGDFTYRQLMSMSLRLASYLTQNFGLDERDNVPICLDPSGYAIVAMLAVNYCGAAWTPLDPLHPKERQLLVAEQVGARLIITEEHLDDRFVAGGIQTLVFDSRFVEMVIRGQFSVAKAHLSEYFTSSHHAEASLRFDESFCDASSVSTPSTASGSGSSTPSLGNTSATSESLSILSPLDEIPKSRAKSTSTAYVLFTSGTTGRPKGLIIDQGSLCTSAFGMSQRMGWESDTRAFQFASYTFDACIGEIFATLFIGGTVCVPSKDEKMNDLAGAINKYRASMLCLAPSVLNLLSPESIPLVKTVQSVGEPISRTIIDTWAHRVQLVNGYGPSETCVYCVTSVVTSNKSPSIIGKPVTSNMFIVDLNDMNKLCPIGVAGELIVQGRAIAKGYLAEPEKTAQAFVPIPSYMDGEVSGTCYRTGDIVRFTEAGEIQYVGRKDSQVKIRGQRVELGEVERHIKGWSPNVKHAVAEVLRNADGQVSKLVAYLCFSEDVDVDTEATDLLASMTEDMRFQLLDLQSSLAARVPIYMIPDLFVPLVKLPVGVSGKLDKGRIRKLSSTISDTQKSIFSLGKTTIVALETDTEKMLATFWADILKIPVNTISRDDHFFRLGADSISAMRLSSLVGPKLPTRQIMNIPQLSAMATYYDQALTSLADLHAPASFTLLPPEVPHSDLFTTMGPLARSVTDAYPCTPLQEGLMALSIKQPNSYKGQNVYRIPQSINLAELKNAWSEVYRQEAMLRTRIIMAPSGEVVQVVINEQLQWRDFKDLQAYLRQDKQDPMKHGDPLSRFGIDENGKMLVLTMHHAIYDGASLGLLLERVWQTYSKRQNIKGPSFSLFVQHLLRQSREANNAYWANRLQHAPEPSFPELEETGTRNERIIARSIPFKRISSNGISASTILTTAYALVTASYSEPRGHACFGQTLSGRDSDLQAALQIAGPTITTVPCHVAIDYNKDVSELMEGIQRMRREEAEFEHFGLSNISQVSDRAKAACKFRSLFCVQPIPRNEVPNTFLDALPQVVDERGFQDYVLLLEAFLGKDEVTLKARYDTRSISEAQMMHILQQIGRVVEQVIQPPHSGLKVGEINLRSSIDSTLHAEMLSKEVPVPEKPLHQFSLDTYEQHARKIAIHAWDGDISYRDLFRMSNKLATWLVSQGSGPGVLIPVCLERSALAIVVLLAVMKSNGAFMPMDPAWPDQRIQHAIESAGCRTILASSEHSSRIQGLCDSKVMTIDQAYFQDILNDVHGTTYMEVPASTVSLDDLAYVLQTSGSTGTPKAVEISHRAVTASVMGISKNLEFGSATRTLHFSSLTFDGFVMEVFPALSHGGTVCIPSSAERLSDLDGFIHRAQVSWVFLTPTVLQLLNPALCTTLKTIAIGGERMPQEVIALWHDLVNFYQVYGPTETCVICTHCRVMSASQKGSLIGRPISCRNFVVNPENPHELAGIGILGELAIQGPTLARGYRNNEEKTKASFVEDVGFLTDSGLTNRIYLTGDLVRLNADNTVSYYGRKDSQVKIRGQRVELGDIESVAKQYCKHADIAVELVKPKNVPPMLVLFTTSTDNVESGTSGHILQNDAEADALHASLESALQSRLPPAWVPTLFVRLASMPLQISGKLDRGALRRVIEQHDNIDSLRAGRTDKEMPTTPTEIMMQQWIASALGREPKNIGRHDSFIRLGGDSLSAMRLAAKARHHGFALSVPDIFKFPRLMDLCLALQPLNESGVETKPFELVSPEQVTEIQDFGTEYGLQVLDAYPTTALQDGLFSLSQKLPGAYQSQHVFRINKSTDLKRLQEAFETVVQHFALLRTVLVPLEEGAYQAVVERKVEWLASNNLEAYLKTQQTQPMSYGDHLSQYALVHDNGETYLCWTTHHAMYDGWSMQLVLAAIENAYYGGQLPKTPYFANFIKHITTKIDPKDCQDFWTRSLEGKACTAYPHAQKTDGRPSLDHNVQAFCPKTPSWTSASTVSNITSAAWALTISRQVCASKVTIGTIRSGRTVPLANIEAMAGPTIATVPAFYDAADELTIADYLEQSQSMMNDVSTFEQYGLQNIAKLSGDANDCCDFRHLFVIQPGSNTIDNAHSLWEPVPVSNATFQTVGLLVECKLQENGVEVDLQFDDTILSQAEAAGLLKRFVQTMDRLATAPGSLKLGEVDTCTAEDRCKILDFTREPVDAIEDTVHATILRHAETRPLAEAVCAWNQTLNYKQLEEMSRRLALHLQGLGIGPETLVPLCFEKCSYFVVSMLAILRASGASVPMDPAFPTARFELIIEDTSAKVILCSRSTAKLFSSFDNLTIVIVDQESLESMPMPPSPASLVSLAGPKNVAAVVYTSGSSGKPKGVMLEHSALCTSAEAHGSALGMGLETRVFNFAASTFDINLQDNWTTLMRGGCVCVPTEHDRLNDIAGAINRLQANWVFLTPTVATLLHPSAVPGLKTLTLAGEAIKQINLDTWSEHVNVNICYGPAECSIHCCWRGHVKADTSPLNVGKAISSKIWLTDPNNTNRLVPPGAIGEIVVSGPLLLREYLRNEAKTSEALFKHPQWMLKSDYVPEKVYKTGDLAVYGEDGSILFRGRKDYQVKFHGQRIELGEIEHGIWTEPSVKHAVVQLPNAGPFKDRLVAVIALHDPNVGDKKTQQCILAPNIEHIQRNKLEPIQNHLAARVPIYMVPSVWIFFEAIPQGITGKQDRVKIAEYVKTVSGTDLKMILQDGAGNSSAAHVAPTTPAEMTLTGLVGKILNLEQATISMSRSFISYSGDSILAIRLVAMARKEGYTVSAQDILRSKSLSAVAQSMIRKGGDRATTDAITSLSMATAPFRLSPIQAKYFRDGNGPRTQFNQSRLYKIRADVDEEKMHEMVWQLLRRHAMLRARFFRSNSGEWLQQVTEISEKHLSFASMTVSSLEDAAEIVKAAQDCLDATKGPVIASRLLFSHDKKQHYLYMVAHHLVIDFVSWSILALDLETMLQSGELDAWSGTSFRSFTLERPISDLSGEGFGELRNEFNLAANFWSVELADNTYAKSERGTITLSEDITNRLLSDCHGPLRTEMVDIVLGCIMNAFQGKFNRSPTVFTESHGRIGSDSDVDLSSTIGWFTNILPRRLKQSGLKDNVVEAKDLRKNADFEGAFRSTRARYESQVAGDELGCSQDMVELLFNFFGVARQTSDSVLTEEEEVPENWPLDVGSSVRRMAIFEISAIVTDGRLRVSVIYPKSSLKVPDIHGWILTTEDLIEEAAQKWPVMHPELTVSDVPNMQLDDQDLKNLNTQLDDAGIYPSQVETMYPCSAMQKDMVAAQIRSPGLYVVRHDFTFEHSPYEEVAEAARRLEGAWRDVVQRHSILRTVFVTHQGTFAQIVLTQPAPKVVQTRRALSNAELLSKSSPLLARGNTSPPHRMYISTFKGKLAARVEISHALTDAISMATIWTELTAAFAGMPIDNLVQPFENVVPHVLARDSDNSKGFWQTELAGIEPTLIKASPTESKDSTKLRMLDGSPTSTSELAKAALAAEVTIPTLVHAAWSWTLAQHLQKESVVFGTVNTGRGDLDDTLTNVVGPTLNVSPVIAHITKDCTVGAFLRAVQEQQLNALPHQGCSLPSADMFNTLMNFRKFAPTSTENAVEMENDELKLVHTEGKDPWDFDVVLGVLEEKEELSFTLEYYEGRLTEETATQLADMMHASLREFADDLDKVLSVRV